MALDFIHRFEKAVPAHCPGEEVKEDQTVKYSGNVLQTRRKDLRKGTAAVFYLIADSRKKQRNLI